MKIVLSSFITIILIFLASGIARGERSMSADTLISVQRLEQLERTEANALDAHNMLMDKDKEVKLLRAKLEALETERTKMFDQLSKAQKKLDEQSSSKLKKNLDQLEKELQEARESADTLAQQNQEYAQTIQKLQDEMALQKDNYDIQIFKLNKELKEMNDIRKHFFQQLIADAKVNWLEKPFGVIDVKELQDKDIPKYRKYEASDKAIGQTYNDLNQLIEDVRTYQEGCHFTQQPFDFEKLNELIGQLQHILQRASSAQQKEVDSLVNVLDEYGLQVRSIQSLISGIEKEFDGNDGWEYLLQGYLDEENESYGTIDDLDSYPWLKEQFDKYIITIKKEGLGDNVYRQTIMNLKTR